MADVTVAIAFFAGLVSFAAPCVLPLVPGYLAYLAGTTLSEAEKRRKEIFLNSLFFVLGFSSIFAALGVLLSTVLDLVAYDAQVWLARIGGGLVILFGFYLIGLLKLPFLEREHKLAIKPGFRSKYLSSFVFGAAFAAGWTPCVSAVLGGILGLAAAAPGSALRLLFAYALGVGVPFLVVGLFAAQAAGFISRAAKFLKYANVVFGLLLIGIGILAATQRLYLIANFDFLFGLVQRLR